VARTRPRPFRAPLGDLYGVFGIAAQQHDELATPVAGHQVVGPRALAKHPRRAANYRVTSPVPVAVVVAVEVVDVQYGAGEGQTVPS
jgi:hypothetical protein